MCNIVQGRFDSAALRGGARAHGSAGDAGGAVRRARGRGGLARLHAAALRGRARTRRRHGRAAAARRRRAPPGPARPQPRAHRRCQGTDRDCADTRYAIINISNNCSLK